MQHNLNFTKPSVVTLEVSWENSQQVPTAFSQVTQNTLCFLLLGGNTMKSALIQDKHESGVEAGWGWRWRLTVVSTVVQTGLLNSNKQH